jgi:hypothetical protein
MWHFIRRLPAFHQTVARSSRIRDPSAIVFSPDGSLVVGDDMNTIRLWRTALDQDVHWRNSGCCTQPPHDRLVDRPDDPHLVPAPGGPGGRRALAEPRPLFRRRRRSHAPYSRRPCPAKGSQETRGRPGPREPGCGRAGYCRTRRRPFGPGRSHEPACRGRTHRRAGARCWAFKPEKGAKPRGVTRLLAPSVVTLSRRFKPGASAS